MPHIDRRTFLRAAGVGLALPLFETRAAAPDRRDALVAVCTTFGLHAPNFIPATPGPGYAATPYLAPLAAVRDKLTVISGLHHPGVDGGHDSEKSFLTAAPHPAAANFRNTVSVDQLAAERVGTATRFPFLALTTGGVNGGSLSHTRTGATVPGESHPGKLFAKLFLAGTPKEVREQVDRLREGRSVLDAVTAPAKTLEGSLGANDRAKLDEYLTAVRELEGRLHQGEAWATKPKPVVTAKPAEQPPVADTPGRLRAMFDLVALALQTDSTRVVTLQVQCNGNVPPVAGVSLDHHSLSHHGKDPDKLTQLAAVELAYLKALADFLGKLQASASLDRTAVLFGSNLGNASSHDTKNLPLLVAGGRFRHGQHLAFDPAKPPPLANVFVSLLQGMGLPADKFASGTGTLRGFEPA